MRAFLKILQRHFVAPHPTFLSSAFTALSSLPLRLLSTIGTNILAQPPNSLTPSIALIRSGPTSLSPHNTWSPSYCTKHPLHEDPAPLLLNRIFIPSRVFDIISHIHPPHVVSKFSTAYSSSLSPTSYCCSLTVTPPTHRIRATSNYLT